MAELDTVEEAAVWIDGLKTGDRDAVLRMLDALRAYSDQKLHGKIAVTVVAGRFKLVDVNQTWKPGVS